jgi:hypothetical protein
LRIQCLYRDLEEYILLASDKRALG